MLKGFNGVGRAWSWGRQGGVEPGSSTIGTIVRRSRRAKLRAFANTSIILSCVGCCEEESSADLPQADTSAEVDCNVKCGACPPAIQVLLIDPDTNREIGWDAVVPAAKIVGVEGECNSFGQCDVPAVGGDPETVYEFQIVFRDQVVGKFATTAEVEPEEFECCLCGYATRTLKVEVDV
jgi:hypothetical protein